MDSAARSFCVISECYAPTITFLCGRHASHLRNTLAAIDELAAELDITLSRQDAVGDSGGRPGAEKPLPLRYAAVQAREALRNTLASWVRELNEGMGWLDVDNTAPALAAWLLQRQDWMANHPAVDELYDEITYAVREGWQAVDRHPLLYLGQCSTATGDGHCMADVYVAEGRGTARCHECGTVHDVAYRREVLLEALEDQVVPTRILVGMLEGMSVTAATIRGLERRHRIAVAGVDCEGHKMFRVGDVRTALTTDRYRHKQEAC